MDDTASAVFPQKIRWESQGTSRIPFMAYTEAEQHKRELERFFYKGHWCYVGLEAEVPYPGDFKRTVVGERSVIMVRDAEGEIRVVENVCAHRGMQFCRERHGNRKDGGFTWVKQRFEWRNIDVKTRYGNGAASGADYKENRLITTYTFKF